VWTLPNTAIGVTAGLAAFPISAFRGGAIRIDNNAIQFTMVPSFIRGGLTLGNSMLFGNEIPTNPDGSDKIYQDSPYTHLAIPLGPHEEAHTLQAQVLGPFFLPAYFLKGGVGAGNSWEVGADHYARGESNYFGGNSHFFDWR